MKLSFLLPLLLLFSEFFAFLFCFLFLSMTLSRHHHSYMVWATVLWSFVFGMVALFAPMIYSLSIDVYIPGSTSIVATTNKGLIMICSTSYGSQSIYPDGCYNIQTDCSLNVNVQGQTLNLPATNKCTRFNIARGATVLGIFFTLVLSVFYMVHWCKLKKLPLQQQAASDSFSLKSISVVTLIIAVLTLVSFIVSFSLLIQEKQDQDQVYDSENDALGPGSFSLTYGASFAFLVIAAASALATIALTLFFLWKEKRVAQPPLVVIAQQPLNPYYMPMP